MNVTGLFAGKPQAFGPNNSPSSIIKSPHNILNVVINGAQEDEQGNKKLHGGPQMALHQFSMSAYQRLAKKFTALTDAFVAGSIGENISAPDMNDDNVFIGDIYAFGDTILQVSSPRAPCSKINHRYGQKKIDLYILEQGITGWYFRVLQEGKIQVGDNIQLMERNEQPVSVKSLMHISKAPKGVNFTKSQIEDALHTPGLAPEWQDKIRRVLVKQDMFS